jgi:predicted nucleic acid-binding Zn ribbon protein
MGRPKGSVNGIKSTKLVYCAVCGKDKQVTPFEYKNSKTKQFYCNRACWGKWLSINLVGENNHNFNGGKIEVKCVICSKPKMVDPARKKFTAVFVCSDKCKGVYNAERYRGENSPKWKPKLEAICSFCGETLIRQRSRAKHYELQFCDTACHGKWISQNNIR